MIDVYYINCCCGDITLSGCGLFKSLRDAAQYANSVLSSSRCNVAYIKSHTKILGKVEHGKFYPSSGLDATLQKEFV